MQAATTTRKADLGRWLWIAVVLCAPHLLGGVPGWATTLMAAVLTVSVALLCSGSLGTQTTGFSPDAFGAVLLAAAVLTALHAVPMPAELTSFVAPRAVLHLTEVRQGLGAAPPGWIPFSIDVGRTYERILCAVAILLSYVGGKALAHGNRGRRCFASVAGSVALVGGSSLFHKAIGARSVYGVYRPEWTDANGPIMNPNNLCGMMAFGLPIALSLGRSGRSGERSLWYTLSGVIFVVAVSTGSRGGLAAAIFGVALYVLLEPRPRRSSKSEAREATEAVDRGANWGHWSRKLLGRMAPLCAVATLAVLGAVPGIADKLYAERFGDLTKFELFRDEIRFLFADPQALIVGVGRGGFGSAFASAFEGARHGAFAETLPMQYGIEFGVPFMLLGLTLAVVQLVRIVRRTGSPLRVGAAVGCVAIGAQNFVDFSLELSGVAVVVAGAFGAAGGGRATRQTAGNRWWGPCTCAAGLLACLSCAWTVVTSDPVDSERALRAALANEDYAEFQKLFGPVARRHPADPVFALLGASHGVLSKASNAAFWLNRAMILAPGWAEPHQWAAQWLAMRGMWPQAGIELSFAAERDVHSTREILCRWLKVRPLADVVLAAAPLAGASRQTILEAGAGCLHAAAPDEAALVDSVVLEEVQNHFPSEVRQLARLVRTDPEAAVLTAERLRDAWPSRLEPYELASQAMLVLNRAPQAIAILEQAATHVDKRVEIFRLLAHAYARAGDAEGMRDTVRRYKVSMPAESGHLANASRLLGRLEQVLGNDARAFVAFQEADSFKPDLETLALAADLAFKLGENEFAMRAWSDLCQRHPSPAPYCKKRDRWVGDSGRVLTKP